MGTDDQIGNLGAESLRKPRRAPVALGRWMRRLDSHRGWLWVMTGGYFLGIVTLHDVMQQPAFWAERTLASSPVGWNNLVSAVVLPVFAVFCVWMVRAIRRHDRPWIAGTYFAITVVLTAVIFRTLLCKNIETVHFLEYAILAVLLFAITGSFGRTIVWTTLAGMFDESYQFFFLYSQRGIYLDYNDMIMNTLGGGWGLVMLYAEGVQGDFRARRGVTRRRNFFLSPAGIAVEFLALVATLMYACGRLRLMEAPHSDRWCVVLRRCAVPSSFWTHITWGKTYHEVQFSEWIVITLPLVGFYMLLDRAGSKIEAS